MRYHPINRPPLVDLRHVLINMAHSLRSTIIAAGLLLAAAAVASSAAGENTAVSSSRNGPLKGKAPTSPVKGGGRRGRIVGGRRVDDYDPSTGVHFIAKLFTPDGNGFYCGGSLISEHPHVLTRAGCNPQVGDVVRLGGARLYDGVVTRVRAKAIHPRYNPVGDVADVAVLTLERIKPWEMRLWRLAPVTLNKKWDRPHGFYLTGYGATDKKARSAGSLQLKRGYQPVAPWWRCRRITRDIRVPGRTRIGLPINQAAQVCLWGSNRSGALCDRDVGGPMFRVKAKYVRADKGRFVKVHVYIQYAISSYWIATPEQRCPQGMPNIGSRVSYYYGWIQRQMK